MENEKKNKRKALILTIIAVLTLLALVGGAAYAYFQTQAGEGGQADVNVTTGTTDSLTFSVLDKDVTRNEESEAQKDKIIDNNGDNEIKIDAKESNFGKTGTSLGDGVTGSTILIAGDNDYKAEGIYNVYMTISKNEVQYTSYQKESDIKNFTNAKTKAEASLDGYEPIPELYLTIRKNGTEIKTGVTINGEELKYTGNLFGDPDADDKTTKTLGGFDITEATGIIKIGINQKIIVEGSKEDHTKTDNWEIMVTFKNLEYDQNLNTGKSLIGKVIIDQENMTQALDTILADTNKEGQTPSLYYYNNKLNGGAQDNSYRYAGTNYEISAEQVDQIINGLYEAKTYGDDATIYYYLKTAPNKELIDKLRNITCYVARLGCEYQADYDANGDGEVDILDVSYFMRRNDTSGYYTSKEAAVDAVASKGLANEYGVTSLVNNYVCLDGTTQNGECANGDSDLYRIIGLFPNSDGLYEMKLVKYDYATKEQLSQEGTYNPDGINNPLVPYKYYYLGNVANYDNIGAYYLTKGDGITNEWNESILRTNNLNEKYLSYLKEKGIDVDNIIVDHNWKTIGYSSTSVPTKTIYDYEMGNIVEDNAKNPAQTKKVKNKIGLIYASDYGYASDPIITNNWTTNISSYSIISNKSNWLYMGLYEWILMRSSNSDNSTYYISYDGAIGNSYNVNDYSFGIRPAFYLSSKTQIASGKGTKAEPYRLKLS